MSEFDLDIRVTASGDRSNSPAAPDYSPPTWCCGTAGCGLTYSGAWCHTCLATQCAGTCRTCASDCITCHPGGKGAGPLCY